MMKTESYCISTYYKINKISMSLIGQWPYQSKTLANFLTCIWIFQHLSILLPELIKFMEIRNNIDYTIESCIPIIYNIGIGIKFYNNIYKRRQIKSILDQIQKDWCNLRNETEIRLMSQYASFGKLLTAGYCYIVCGSMCLYLSFSLMPYVMDKIKPLNESRPKNLIYFVEFFVDEKKYFFHITMHAYITTIIGVISLISIDTFYASSVQHACGMLFILGHRLKSIKGEKKLIEKYNDIIYQELIASIIQHNKIIQYCENINKIYSDSFFFIMGLNMFIMSITGALIIFKWGQVYEMIRNGMFAGSQIIHLLYYNFQGQFLMNQSLLLSDCIYDSEWYTISLRIRKIMTIMIMRSLKPIKLTAKIFLISLKSFTSVSKTSMSYVTVLKSLR